LGLGGGGLSYEQNGGPVERKIFLGGPEDRKSWVWGKRVNVGVGLGGVVGEKKVIVWKGVGRRKKGGGGLVSVGGEWWVGGGGGVGVVLCGGGGGGGGGLKRGGGGGGRAPGRLGVRGWSTFL
jgi:hypothetical protein